jgi:RHS repeat-associated protein
VSKSLRLNVRITVAWVFVASALLVNVTSAFAQRQLLCDSDTACGPDPTTSTTVIYDGAVAARTKIMNQRRAANPLVMVSRMPMVKTVIGSRSYDYSINLISLAGRNNANVNLSLMYNSRIWSRSADGLTLNTDIDNPSLGFRGVDFGFLQWSVANSDWILTAANGGKNELINVSGTSLYQSQDSTYMQFNGSTNVLTYHDGTQVFYEQFGAIPFNSTSPLRPNKIENTNGNIISITYTNTLNLSVNSITDTLGRVVNFAYDASGRLTSISQGPRTITFAWNTAYVLNYQFSIPVISSPASGSTRSVLSSVTFADHTTVNFLYGDWGVVSRIERRSTNGTLRSFVSYNFPPASAGALSDSPAFTQQTVFDGVNTSFWNYSVAQNSSGLVTSSAVTDPYGTTTTTTFSSAGDWKDGLPLTEKVTDTTGKTWRTRTKSWTSDTGTSAVNPRVASVLTQLDDGTQSKVTYAYDANGNLADTQETDFGAGAPGPLLRETVTSYATLGNHILNRPAQVLEKNANGTVSRTDFGYDGYSVANPLQPISPAASQHDDANYSTVLTSARGNLTSKTVYTNAAAGTGTITSTFAYDVLGNRVSVQQGCCTQARSIYSVATQYAFPDSVAMGPIGSQLTSNFIYNFSSGTTASTTDANGQVTTYTYDANNRVTSTHTPDGIIKSTSYDDAGANPAWTSSTTADSQITTVVKDYTGHELSNKLFNGANLVSTISSSYDALGRLTQSSNAYGPGETAVYTTHSYDALGRDIQRTPPALTAGVAQTGYQTSFSGHTATFTDPTGRQRKEYHNALGELVEVDEPGVVPVVNNYATMQTDGNFVLYNPSNSALWSTGTYGTNAGPIYIQDDGNLVLYTFKWFAGTYAAPSPGPFPAQGCSIGSYLMVNQRLNANQCLVSPHGQYLLYMASDGNFFIYDLAHNIGTWGPGTTYGHPGAYAIMQGDGNLCVYDANNIYLWCSGTNGTNADRLNMEDDGRIVIYKSVWSSGTSNGNFNQTSLAHPGCDVGNSGIGWTGVLGAGSCIVSPNGHFELLMQTDGNLVIYDRSVNPAHATWNTGTAITGLSPGVAIPTLYTYDVLGNLLQVNQGQQVRTFAYDSLGHMMSLKIPEKANQAVTLTYTDFGAIATRTDARGVTTTYGYDNLGHLTSITYSDGTPPVTYSYGAAGAPNFGAGRLISATDGAGSESYQYDSMGRETKCTRVIGANTYVITYAYTPDGRIASITYPSGRIVTNQYDNIGRLTQVGTGGSSLLNINSYSAAGQILGALYGNGIQASYGYNNQLQVASILIGNASPLLNLSYNWGGANDDGLLMGVTDNLNSARTTSYTYDQLKRLATAQTVDLTSPGTWQLQFTYDRYGNRLNQTPTGGTATMPSNSVTVDPTTNRIGTGVYDADGNMTADGINNYTFDAEDRITHVNGAANTYAYDGAGQRVNRNGNYYVYSGGHVIAEYANGAPAASPSTEYVYARNKRVATIAAGATTYPYWDHLSVRANADSSGTVVRTFGHFPFGETWYETGTHDKWDYTTYENDAESGLNYAMARFHNPRLGRFMSLDPWPADKRHPQSWNRYPHGNNNPVSFSDPTGMDSCDDEGGDCSLDSSGSDNVEELDSGGSAGDNSGGDNGGGDNSGDNGGTGDPSASNCGTDCASGSTGNPSDADSNNTDPSNDNGDQGTDANPNDEDPNSPEQNPEEDLKAQDDKTQQCDSIQQNYDRSANESNAKWDTRFWGSVGAGAATGGLVGALAGGFVALLYDESSSEYNHITENSTAEWKAAGCSGNLKSAF